MFRFLLILFICIGCTKSTDVNDVETFQKKWEKLGITNYEFTLRVICFCTLETVGPHTIVVKNNEIITVNGAPYDSTKHYSVKTIKQLFDFIQESLAKKPASKTLEFDTEYYFPSNVAFDFSTMIADEEMGYRITYFKQLY